MNIHPTRTESAIARHAPQGVLGAVAIGALMLAASVLVRANPGPVPSVEAAAAKSYVWKEYRIRMRDGVRLFTAVASPDDGRDYPILLERTPYGASPNQARHPQLQSEFAQAGYIFVFQDVRGRYESEGVFTQNTPQRPSHRSSTDVDESTDTYDTIDWLVKNVAHNNHHVGLRGISYPGFFAAVGMIDAHPALRAVSPQAAEADWFIGDDVHQHGALLLDSSLGWMSACLHLVPGRSATQCADSGMQFGTPDDYEFFLNLGPIRNVDAHILHGSVGSWTELMEHGRYDSYWKQRNELPFIRDIRPAVLMVGGWYDANDFYGTLHIYQRLISASPRASTYLIIGPWYHGQWHVDDGSGIDQLSFEQPTSEFFVRQVELPFFEYYLKDGKKLNLPRAQAFDTGLNRWRQFGTWPPQDTESRKLYLQKHGVLALDVPSEDDADRVYDEYISDPNSPVPYTPILTTDMDPKYMARDQRFVRRRPDVLIYESAPLAEDLTLAGPITPHLSVSTSGTDCDWIVKLIDVYPVAPAAYVPSAAQKLVAPEPSAMAGFQRLVRGDVMRSKFRSSLETPEPMTPNAVSSIEFVMDDVLHTFKKGHRVMVQIQSSWFPLVDRNPQSFVDIYTASTRDFQTAMQRVYHSRAEPSYLALQVLRQRDSDGSGRQ